MHTEGVMRPGKSQRGLSCSFNYSCPNSIPACSTSISLRYFQLLHILMQLSENEAIPPLDEPGQIALA